MTTSYCTVESLAAEVGISDGDDDAQLTLAITSASRQIDDHCGRRFYQDDAVVVRSFYAESARCVDLLDQPDDGPSTEISTTTGLIVKIDEDGDGTFGTTLTISTDFILLPLNAAADGHAFSQIYLADNYSFPRPSNGRPGVQVTAKFGWPSIPDNLEKACVIQAAQLYHAKKAMFGAVQLGDSAAMRARPMDPVAAGLLGRLRKPAIG